MVKDVRCGRTLHLRANNTLHFQFPCKYIKFVPHRRVASLTEVKICACRLLCLVFGAAALDTD